MNIRCWVARKTVGCSAFCFAYRTTTGYSQNYETWIVTSLCLSLCPSVRLSVRPFIFPSAHPHGTTQPPLDWFSLNSISISRKCMRQFNWHCTPTRITCTLHEDEYTYFIIFRSFFFLECEMFQTKFVEKIKTHILCSITFFFSKIVRFMTECEYTHTHTHTHIYIYIYIVVPGRSQTTISCMRIACWITKATNTHTHNM